MSYLEHLWFTWKCTEWIFACNNKSLPEHGPDPPVATIEDILITEQDVLDQLSNLNVNKPIGQDGLTPKLLKQLSSSICKPLV